MANNPILGRLKAISEVLRQRTCFKTDNVDLTMNRRQPGNDRFNIRVQLRFFDNLSSIINHACRH
jgi:hypothetical protein